jgi:hypothetical protein
MVQVFSRLFYTPAAFNLCAITQLLICHPGGICSKYQKRLTQAVQPVTIILLLLCTNPPQADDRSEAAQVTGSTKIKDAATA